jgi:hypothetical protein
VQQHGVGGDQALTAKAVQVKRRCRRDIERLQPLLDHIQPTDGAAIIVLVMADEQAIGETF